MNQRFRSLPILFILFVPAALSATTHRDCGDYCGTDQECHLAIESQHESLGGCTNYGYTSAGLETAGAHCSTSYDPQNKYIWNTMDCNTMGSCNITGVISCPNGRYNLGTINCGHSGMGEVRIEVDRNSVTCTWDNGHGFSVGCGPNGTLTVAW